MSKIDEMIRDALKCEERENLKQDGELTYFALGLKQFTGVNGWVTWVLMIAQVILFLLGVFCLSNFYFASESVSALKWGLSGSTLLVLSMQLKLSIGPQMQADRIMHELRRLELRLCTKKDVSDLDD